jgi:hypothetical protein
MGSNQRETRPLLSIQREDQLAMETKQTCVGSDSELVSLIDSALGLPVSESTMYNLRAYKQQIQSGSIEDDDRKYAVAFCNRLLRAAKVRTPRAAHRPTSEALNDKEPLPINPIEDDSAFLRSNRLHKAESWAGASKEFSKEFKQALPKSGSNPSGKPKSRWFKPIKSREEALKTVKAASSVFFVAYGIHAIIALAVLAKYSQWPVPGSVDTHLS